MFLSLKDLSKKIEEKASGLFITPDGYTHHIYKGFYHRWDGPAKQKTPYLQNRDGYSLERVSFNQDRYFNQNKDLFFYKSDLTFDNYGWINPIFIQQKDNTDEYYIGGNLLNKDSYEKLRTALSKAVHLSYAKLLDLKANQSTLNYTGCVICGDTFNIFKDGKLHNENAPAVYSHINNKLLYFRKGEFHRLDGPAVISPNEPERYYINGIQYSKEEFDSIPLISSGIYSQSPDGIYKKNNSIFYVKNGKYHRDDGPAILNANGTDDYYFNGFLLSKEQFESIIRNNDIKEIKDLKLLVPDITDEKEAYYTSSKSDLSNKKGAYYTSNDRSITFINTERKGPTYYLYDGSALWYKGKHLHRLDGPAVIEPNQENQYWIDGKQYNKHDYDKSISQMKNDNIQSIEDMNYILSNKKTGIFKTKDAIIYAQEGMVHRDNGPAIHEYDANIKTWAINGIVIQFFDGDSKFLYGKSNGVCYNFINEIEFIKLARHTPQLVTYDIFEYFKSKTYPGMFILPDNTIHSLNMPLNIPSMNLNPYIPSSPSDSLMYSLNQVDGNKEIKQEQTFDKQPVVKLEESKTMFEKIIEKSKERMESATYRSAGRKLTSGIKNAILSMFKKHGADDGVLSFMSVFLDTKAGTAFISTALGIGLEMAPIDIIKKNKTAQKMAIEFQTEGMSEGMGIIMEELSEFFLPVIMDVMKTLPSIDEESASKETNHRIKDEEKIKVEEKSNHDKIIEAIESRQKSVV